MSQASSAAPAPGASGIISATRFNLDAPEIFEAPFRYATFEECLPTSAANVILDWFESSAAPWNRVETNFYEQHEFSCLDAAGEVAAVLTSDSTIGGLRDDLTRIFGHSLRPEATVVAHRLLPGHRIGIHNDHLVGGETHRFVIQLNRGLSDADGGFFMLFNSADPSDIHAIFRPVSLSGFAFEISPQSHHAISEMHSSVRYSIVYSFFRVS